MVGEYAKRDSYSKGHRRWTQGNLRRHAPVRGAPLMYDDQFIIALDTLSDLMLLCNPQDVRRRTGKSARSTYAKV
jgi:hypothetical protein